MTQWTNAAREALENYLARARTHLATADADPNEVIDDLRRHFDEEVAASKLQVLTGEDVRRIIARIGDRLTDALPSQTSYSPPAAAVKQPIYLTTFLLGVVLPVITIAIELATHMCAGVFFDPLPTWWHVLLVSFVPASNLGTWLILRRQRPVPQVLWLANGVAAGVAVFYSILFAPLIPVSIVAIIIYGMGLLPLTALLCAVAALRLRNLMKRPDVQPRPHLARWWWAAASGSAALLLLALPGPLTRHWARMAASDSPATAATGLKWLRRSGHEATLLRDCYGTTRWQNNGPFGWNTFSRSLDPEQARTLYFRVTGKPFNSVPPPQRKYGRGGWDELNDFSWDDAHGGEAVAGQIKGLSLTQSRLDGLCDPNAAWEYVEWTMEFKNDSGRDREARAQIELPPGGVVSRLTLWVNGEEREAAFAGRSQVREAYRQVAVVQRRDPVLVTSCGPGRVLMQCFPVPSNGGTMKIRLGVTAPLQLESGSGVVRWPGFIERNFNLAPQLEHSLWLEASQPLTTTTPQFKLNGSKPNAYAVHGQISDSLLNSAGSVVRARRSPGTGTAWVPDHATTDGAMIHQTITTQTSAPIDRVVFVLDSTRGMDDFFPDIAAALRQLPSGVEFGVVLARDGAEVISEIASATQTDRVNRMAAELTSLNAVGGHDNLTALVRGWDLAAEKPNGIVIWVHGPQPILLENVEALKQRLQWRPGQAGGPVIHDFQVRPGPNRLVEKLDGVMSYRPVPRFGTVAADLDRLIASWRPNAPPVLELVRSRLPATEASPLPGGANSKHLVRLWAHEEIERLIAGKKLTEAIKLAGLYQLVTSVSGAVVLETKQQFDAAGLTPVDATTVPVVPEPGTWVLLVIALGMGLAARRWRKAGGRVL